MECNIPDNTELENELVLEVVRPELLVGGNTVATFARLVAATLPAASVDIMKNSFIATIQVVWRNCCLHPRGTSMDLGREKMGQPTKWITGIDCPAPGRPNTLHASIDVQPYARTASSRST